jgi:hypothetical protein
MPLLLCAAEVKTAALGALIASVSASDAPASADDGTSSDKQQRLAAASVAAGVCNFCAAGVPKQQNWSAAKQQCGQDDSAGGAQQRATTAVAL